MTSRTPSSPIRAEPITAKRRDGSSRPGHYRAQFESAWARYCAEGAGCDAVTAWRAVRRHSPRRETASEDSRLAARARYPAPAVGLPPWYRFAINVTSSSVRCSLAKYSLSPRRARRRRLPQKEQSNLRHFPTGLAAPVFERSRTSGLPFKTVLFEFLRRPFLVEAPFSWKAIASIFVPPKSMPIRILHPFCSI